MRSFRMAGALAPVLLVAGCDLVEIETRDTAITLSVDRTTAAVGDTLAFRYEAQGRALSRVVVDYGDGTADTATAIGSQVAAGTLKHAYGAPASYVVTATVEESDGGAASGDVTVQVQPPAGGG